MKFITVFLLLSVQVSNAQIELLYSKTIPFPSASAIEFHRDRLYVFGDDATHLLVLDMQYKAVDSIRLFTSGSRRIPKETKADLEACTLITDGKRLKLISVSSFSTPSRNRLVTATILPLGLKVKTVNYRQVHRYLTKKGIREVNIEGMTAVGKQMILANRANTTNRQNYLIIIPDISKPEKNIRIRPLLLSNETEVKGISGLAYIPSKDLLLFTASVEDTPNAYADGTIGDSYIGYVSQFSKKMKQTAISADQVINLTATLGGERKNKIESVAVESIAGNEIILHLSSDNDNGESTLFKLNWKL